MKTPHDTTTHPPLDSSGKRVGARAFGTASKANGIGVASAHVFRTARNLDEDDGRAVRWLAGYARLLDRTADSFAGETGLSITEIRAAMTDPDLGASERAVFSGAVNVLRAEFEERLDKPFAERGNPFAQAVPFHRALGQLAETAVRRKVRSAVRFAERENAIALVMMKERIGKTISAAHEFLRRLDSAAWMRVPAGNCMRSFITRAARACGVPCGDNSSSAASIASRLEAVLGPGKIELLFIDQAHWLWPTDARKNVPLRWESVMDWNEQCGASVVLVSTPQHEIQSHAAAGNQKHAHGQISGRVETYTAGDTLSEADLGAILDLHAQGVEFDAVERAILVAKCKTQPGYLGSLRLTCRRIARGIADEQPRPGETSAALRKRIVMEAVGVKGGE